MASSPLRIRLVNQNRPTCRGSHRSPSALPPGQPKVGNGVSGWTMGGGQRMNWVKDPNSHFSKLDMGGEGCVDNRRMERGRCEADILMKPQSGQTPRRKKK